MTRRLVFVCGGVAVLMLVGLYLHLYLPRYQKRSIDLPNQLLGSGFFRVDSPCSPPRFVVIYSRADVSAVTGSRHSMEPTPGLLVVARNGIYLDGREVSTRNDRVFVFRQDFARQKLVIEPVSLSASELELFAENRLPKLHETAIWPRVLSHFK